MEIVISLMLIALLFMIYDLVNAPAVDEDENLVFLENDSTEEGNHSPDKVLF